MLRVGSHCAWPEGGVLAPQGPLGAFGAAQAGGLRTPPHPCTGAALQVRVWTGAGPWWLRVQLCVCGGGGPGLQGRGCPPPGLQPRGRASGRLGGRFMQPAAAPPRGPGRGILCPVPVPVSLWLCLGGRPGTCPPVWVQRRFWGARQHPAAEWPRTRGFPALLRQPAPAPSPAAPVVPAPESRGGPGPAHSLLRQQAEPLPPHWGH